MKTDDSDNDKQTNKGTGTEEHFSKEIFHTYNELFKVGQLITSEIDYDVLFDVIIKETNRIMDVERCSIFLLDEKGEMLNAFASAGIGGLSIQVPKNEGIVGWVFDTREPAIVNDARKDPRFYAKIDEETDLNTNNILCVPLINRSNECIGALEVINKKKGEFTIDDRNVLNHLSNYVAIALENATLYRELKMMDRAKERVINHLAHELSTPISVVSGVIASLARKLAKYDSEKAEKLKKLGLKNANRLMEIQNKADDIVANRPVKEKEFMINLVRDAAKILSDVMEENEDQAPILEKIYDRIESIYKEGETTFEEIHLKEFLANILADTLSQSPRKNFMVQKDLDERLTLKMDKRILGNILFGLIKNAIENTPDEGKIGIKAYLTEKDIVIDCIDHGVGITRENQNQIFGGFFHTQDTNMYSTKKPFAFDAGGAGIDLLRTKILSEKFGYTLDLKSNRCAFIMFDSDHCPGAISDCPHIKDKEECFSSGGSTFSIRFPQEKFGPEMASTSV